MTAGQKTVRKFLTAGTSMRLWRRHNPVCRRRTFRTDGGFGSTTTRRVREAGPTRRSGFTLFEILLVLGIILAFASITIPSVMRMFGRRKLTESAERVRVVAASARVQAIDSGLIYQFCCESGGRHFVAVPFEADHASTGQGGQQGGGGQVMPVIPARRVWGQLPNGIVFSSVALGSMSNPAMMPSGPQKIAMTSLEGLPNSGDLANLNWSPPIFYNSDGSANTDAQIVISDSRSQQITLHVRSLTGSVSMDRLVSGKRK